MRKHRFAIFAAALLSLSVLATGQAVNTARISGIITDTNGASIPGAEIKVTQTATGLTRVTTTEPDGSYSLASLPVGPYQLQVKAKGFGEYVQKGIVLQVGESPRMDIALKVGTVEQVVEVTSAVPLVEQQNTSVSTVIDQRRIVDLPLNGRQATQLVILSGAATNTTLASNDLISTKNYGNGVGTSSVTISVAGGQVNGTNYVLDGGDNNDSFSNVNLPFPFPDALQEYSVQTSTSSARYGLHPGAVVSLVTKSGTNKFHGDVFEFIRNNAVNAKRYAFPGANPTPDTLKRNQFGGTLGGPVLRDKLMFFAGYQGTRNRSTPTPTSVLVPTAAARSGDFSTMMSAACQSSGTARLLRDPVTNQNFANNFINPARFDSAAMNLLKLVPVSTDPCGKLSVSIPTTGDEDQGVARLDYIRSQKHSIFARYFIADFRDPAIFDQQNILTATKAGQLSRSHSLTLSDTYTFTPTLLNTFHLTGTRLAIDRSSPGDIPNFTSLGVNIPNPLDHAMVLSISGYFNVASGTATPGHFNRNALQVADDVDWTLGRHQLSFGVDWVHNRLNELSNFQTNGQFTFNTTFTRDGLADFMLGLPTTFAQGNPEWENWRQNYVALYLHDNYRIRRNLMLNLGLRWDPYYPAHDVYKRGSHFDLAAYTAGTKSSVFTNAPPGVFFCGDTQTPCSYVNSKAAQFSPRVGLVWDPFGNGKQSIRAGYGIFYDNAETFYFDRFADNSPYGAGISLSSPAGGFRNPYQGQSVPPFPTPFPTSSSNAFFPANAVWINSPLDLHPTYVQQWNLSIDRQLGNNWGVSVSYLGNKTTHLWLGYEANAAVFIPGTCGSAACSTTGNTQSRRVLSRINPTAGAFFSSVTQAFDGADASYNGLLLAANHRFSQNFSLNVNYTWSHCISDGDFNGELTNSRQTQTPDPRVGERGNCGFDRRQLFNSSLVVSSPRFQSRPLRLLLGDWQLANILSYTTGQMITVLTGSDRSLSGIGKDRPNQVGDPFTGTCPNGSPVGSLNCWFNTAAFAQNATGSFGNAPRNSIVGPGFLTFDPNIARSFRIRESQNLQVRFEVFNVLNHPNFGNPVLTLSSGQFGQVRSIAGEPRVFQLAMKYSF